MTQMVSEIYYLLRFDLQCFDFDNFILEFMSFLQFNSYYKIIVKFLTVNACDERKIIYEKVFEGNSTNISI